MLGNFILLSFRAILFIHLFLLSSTSGGMFRDQIKIQLSVSHPNCTYHSGLSIRRPQSGKGCPVRTFYGEGGGGSLDADVRTFWCKNFRFFRNLWCVRTDKGVEPVQKFCGQGRLRQCENFADKGGQFFAILCGHLLWTPLTNTATMKNWS